MISHGLRYPHAHDTMISHHIPSAFEPGANLRVKDQQKLMPLQLALANGHLHLAPWIRC